MAIQRFTARVELPVPVEEAYAWHLRPGAFERLTPPWEQVRVLATDGVREGGRAVFELAIGPLHERWVAVHREVVPNKGFVDEQLEGPFKSWVHRHRFEAAGPGACVLTDEIDYALPLGALGRLVGGGATQRRLERMFAWRHAVLADDLRRHRELERVTLRIGITGASGLVGSALSAMLTAGGHTVRPIVRRAPSGSEIAWDPVAGTIETQKLGELDAVVHLAGENLSAGRWTETRKRAIRDSRVRGTTVLAEALAKLPSGPRTLVSMSAVGWYGDREQPVDEDSAAGTGFLAEVCEAWERAADPAREAGIRVVHPRMAVVLSPAEGALPKLVSAFRAGVGGRVGRGTQGMSWIAIDDAVAGLHAALLRRDLSGPVNLCAPELVDNDAFTHTLAQVLNRPSFVPLPEAAVKLAFGEMGETLLLQGAEVRPTRLLAAGHRFAYPRLEPALRHLLGC